MNNLIGFSTGPIHSWRDSIDELIGILKQLDIDAIELNFGKTNELHAKLSPTHIEYLKSLPFVSIHAPFWNEKGRNFYYKDNDKSKETISLVKQFYGLVNAKAVCFHPDLLTKKILLEKSNMNVCLENLTRDAYNDISFLLQRFPQYGMVLDTAHALKYGLLNLDNQINENKERIQYVHFSDFRFSEYHGKEKPHKTFYDCENPDKFRKLKDLNCPIIIENSLKLYKDDFSVLKKELESVRAFFQ